MNRKNIFNISRVYLLGSVFLLNSAPLKALDQIDGFSPEEHLLKKGAVEDPIKRKEKEPSKKNVDALSYFGDLKKTFQDALGAFSTSKAAKNLENENKFSEAGEEYLKAARTCYTKEREKKYLFKAASCFKKEGELTSHNPDKFGHFTRAAATYGKAGHYLASAQCYQAAGKVPDIDLSEKMSSHVREAIALRDSFHKEASISGFSREKKMACAKSSMHAFEKAADCVEEKINKDKAILLRAGALMAYDLADLERAGKLYHASACSFPPDANEDKKFCLARAAACFRRVGLYDKEKECQEALAALDPEKGVAQEG